MVSAQHLVISPTISYDYISTQSVLETQKQHVDSDFSTIYGVQYKSTMWLYEYQMYYGVYDSIMRIYKYYTNTDQPHCPTK